LPYFGNLAYVVGAAKKTDSLLIVVVPRICWFLQDDEMMEIHGNPKKAKEQCSGQKNTKAAKLP
jgi:hypothetical protein